jgi:hypothetical protein
MCACFGACEASLRAYDEPGQPLRVSSFEELLSRLARLFDAAKISYMVIGGQAVLIHGEPRLTMDVDVTLGLGTDDLDRIIALIAQEGLSPIPEDPSGFALQTCVLPARDSRSGERVDLIFSDTPYERQAIGRGVRLNIAGTPVCFASPEDLLIHKLVAGRPRDIEDARSVWQRRKSQIETAYMERWIKEFSAVPGLEKIPDLWRQIQS